MSQMLKPKPLFLTALALLVVLGLFVAGTAMADSKDGNDKVAVKMEDDKKDEGKKDDDNGRGRDDHPMNCDGDNSGPYRDVCPKDKQDDDHDGKKDDDDDDKPVVIYPKPDDNDHGHKPPVVVVNKDVDVNITVNNIVVHVVNNTTVNHVVNLINNGTIVINVNSNNGNTITEVVAPRETPRATPRGTPRAQCPRNAIRKLVVYTRGSNLHQIKVQVNGRTVKVQNGHGRNSARIYFRPGATPFKMRIVAKVEKERTGEMSTFRSRLRTISHCRGVFIDP